MIPASKAARDMAVEGTTEQELESKVFCKGSKAHKNSVMGVTVGGPLKDTSCLALNIGLKPTAIRC